jgi:hypothetical protein
MYITITKTRQKERRDQRGVALITVLFILVIAILVVSAVFTLGMTEIGSVTNNMRAEQALNLAEAGIDWAKANLITRTASNKTFPLGTGTGAGTVNVTITSSSLSATSTVYTIRSTSLIPGNGNSPDAQRAISANILYSVTSTGSSPVLSGFWKRPLTANVHLELFADNITVNAQDVQGPALLSNNAGYSGKIDTTQLTIYGGDPQVGYTGNPMQFPKAQPDTCSKMAAADPVTTPTRAFSYLLGQAQAGSPTQLTSTVTRGVTFTGGSIVFPSGHGYPNPVRLHDGTPSGGISYNVSIASTVNGTLYAEGNITIQGSNADQVIHGPIYVNGDMAVTGKNVSITGPLWVNGHIQISCNGTLNITGPIYVSDWFEIKAKYINLSGVIYAKTWIHFNSWQTITSTGPGVTLVSEGEVEMQVGTGSQEINLTALNGLGILAGDYLHILGAKYFSASGLLYAEDSIEFSVSEKFSLDGVFATKDHFKIATPKQLKLNWVDLSSVLPTEIGGASPTPVISITQQSWREVNP